MTIYNEIKLHLEKNPKARERKNKNRFIAWILENKYGGRFQTGSSVSLLTDVISDAFTYDRAWRQVLQLESNLRGSDYEEKKALMKDKEVELGYEHGGLSDKELQDIVDKMDN